VNIQEYILSGAIESYVLGLASAEERAEFENLCEQYPELIEARNRFEIALEKESRQFAITADENVKHKLMQAISQVSPVNQSNVIKMESRDSQRRRSSLGWVAAASVILLLGASFFVYRFYTETKDLKKTNSELETRLNATDSLLNRMAGEQRIMRDPNVAVVNMVGTTKAPQSSASVYWDSTSSDVYLVVKNMPELPNDKQYQLWALINGQPKSLGLFDIKGTDKKLFLKMSNTQNADAFAVTIERRGNTAGPDLEQLQNMGKVKL
jgi:anti-sigma-K factor RskA